MLADKKKELKLAIQQWQFLGVIFVLILIAVVAFIMIAKAMSHSPNVNDVAYSYTQNNNINYKVHLYDNSFYDEKYLGMNKVYTASLIEKIETYMQYNYSNSKKDELTYTYGIVGTIIGSYGDKSEDSLWTKKYTLLEETTKTVESVSSVNINEKINIDFPTYVSQVEEYKKQLKLSISAYLDVVMTVNVKNGDFKDSEKIEMKIPLSESTLKITTNYTNEESKTVFKENYNEDNVDMPRIIFGSILLVFSTVMFIITFRNLFNATKKSEYQITLNKILKNYGEVIVEVEKFNVQDKDTILSIKTIDDMIDLEEELHIPVIYYEKYKEREGWFIIQHDNHIYRYILKNETPDEANKMEKRKERTEKQIIKKAKDEKKKTKKVVKKETKTTKTKSNKKV